MITYDTNVLLEELDSYLEKVLKIFMTDPVFLFAQKEKYTKDIVAVLSLFFRHQI